MGYLKLTCGECGREWEVYAHQMEDERANQCPHCFAEIDRQTWDQQIVPAFLGMDDANRELMKDSTGYHKPLFHANYLS